MNEASKLSRRTLKLPVAAVIAGTVLFYIVAYVALFVVPRSASFSYAVDTCLRQLTLLPGLQQATGDSGYQVGYKDGLVVGGVPLVSTRTCFEPVDIPQPGQVSVSTAPLGSVFMKKNYTLDVPSHPVADANDLKNPTIAVTRTLDVSLSSHDSVFDYKLIINGEENGCETEDATVRCALEPLGLAQGKQYDAELQRYFKEQALGTVGSGDITTLKALQLKKSSVKNGQTIYSKPKSFTFTFDKDLTAGEAIIEQKTKSGYAAVDSTISTKGKVLSVTPAKELKREATFRITLKKAESADGSVLADVLKRSFTMSGGPKVTDINIGGYGVAQTGTIVITFDQTVDNWGDVSKLVSLSGLNGQLQGSGKQLTIPYSASTCASFSITVKDGFESKVGVKQDDDWRFDGRIRCYTMQSIGSSHQGRTISAYTFGSGSRVILFTGAIHGNEYSARDLMYAWIDELDANIGKIAKGTKVIVVPVVNPDGVAAGSRYNSRGVDLNRNYDTSDWQEDTQTVTGDPLPGGGGSSPGSEKETKALVAFTSSLQPTLTMSYHSQAAYAIGNQCGNSASKASTYAQLASYQNMTGVSGAFSYEITGTYDDWICERLGLPSVLIELATQYSAEFSRNQAAMWAMVQ